MIDLIPVMLAKRLVSANRLKACKLWLGSNLETDFRFGGITVMSLARSAATLRAADDRTPEEEVWLKAMLDTLADNGVEPIERKGDKQ